MPKPTYRRLRVLMAREDLRELPYSDFLRHDVDPLEYTLAEQHDLTGAIFVKRQSTRRPAWASFVTVSLSRVHRG